MTTDQTIPETQDPIETQTTSETQDALPLIVINDSDGKLQLTIRDGVSGWEALGALEVAALLIRNTYTNISNQQN